MMLLWKIFLVFTRVSLFSWAAVRITPLMQRETTPRMDHPAEFADAVRSERAPGPIAPRCRRLSATSWQASGAVAAGRNVLPRRCSCGDGRAVLRVKDSPPSSPC